MGFTCRQIAKEYTTSRGVTTALVDVDVSVGEGEFVSVVGPSGCGKTTLLKLVAGVSTPTRGRVDFHGTTDGRPAATLVFQEHGLYEWMRVVDNVAFGLEARGVGRAERRSRARELIERMGLGEFADAYPHELSVGMRQRVGLARSFLTGSKNLLMDEPFGSLDAQTKVVLQQELLELWEHDRKSVLYVTHDIEEAVALSDRVLVMSGRPGTILENIVVPLDRPRSVGPMKSAESGPIEWHIWTLLKDEVVAGLRSRR